MRNPRSLQGWSVLALLWSVQAALGCAAGGAPPEAPDSPRIDGLSTVRVAVGERLELFGSGLPERSDGWADVQFVGEFRAADGTTSAVDFTVPLLAGEPGVLAWQSFGAYRIPFGDGLQVGVFVGEIRATARYYDGSSTEPSGRGLLAQIEVAPSVVVRDFRAMGDGWYADCAEPTTTAIHGVAYGMRVRAVGFTPVRTEFVLSPGFVMDDVATTDVTRITQPDADPEQAILVRPAMVPDYVDGFVASVSVRMIDDTGTTHELDYPIAVRRPMEVVWNTRMEVAELLPPEPVSGCIAGGGASVVTEYSESRSETRTRGWQRAMARNWTTTVGEQSGETYGSSLSQGVTDTTGTTTTMTDATSQGGSVTDTDTFTRTDGRMATTSVNFTEGSSDTIGWSVGRGHTDSSTRELGRSVSGGVTVGANGEASTGILPGGKVGGSVEGTVGTEASYRRGWGSSDTETVGAMGARTDMTSVARGATEGTMSSVSESRSRAVGSNWERSQSYSEANSFSRALSTEATRSYQQSVQQSRSVAESLGTTETELYSVSTTEASSLSTQSWVWAGQFGVWYRQTTRLVRRGVVVTYDLCGNSAQAGQVRIDDWRWAPDLAVGPSCPPPSNLPAAECRIEPCGSVQP
ncbi:MAG: hypothetical protein ACK5U8_06510 [Deltaproteobacteria bacterium]